jgi:hypothetical protein
LHRVELFTLFSFLQFAFFVRSGPKPEPPLNVSARLLPKDGSIQITWQAPQTHIRITHYVIEYRTVGHWVSLCAPQPASPNGENSYTWKTASRGAVYQFRVSSSTDKDLVGEASPVVTVHTTGKLKPHLHFGQVTIETSPDSACTTFAYLIIPAVSLLYKSTYV